MNSQSCWKASRTRQRRPRGQRVPEGAGNALNLSGHEVFTSASIGITVGGPEYERPEDLLRDADTAMFGAKVTGKARHEVFDSNMRARGRCTTGDGNRAGLGPRAPATFASTTNRRDAGDRAAP